VRIDVLHDPYKKTQYSLTDVVDDTPNV